MKFLPAGRALKSSFYIDVADESVILRESIF